jgi:hypothetical protein
MTAKTITSTYNAGYTLSAAFSALSITAKGYVFAIGGSYGSNSASPTQGGNGQAAVLMPTAANAYNSGGLLGGAGGHGGSSSGAATGGTGGAGGAGVRLDALGLVANALSITGGAGGAAGSSASGVGGYGGYGGAGVVLAFTGDTLHNHGTITGGAGGLGGGAPARAGDGGGGGAGVDERNSGQMTNSGVIQGGVGGDAGAGDPGAAPAYFYDSGGPGGSGIEMSPDSTLINTGQIIGGSAGSGAFGTRFGSDGGDGGEGVNNSTDQTSIINRGVIEGGVAGAGGGAGVFKSVNGYGGHGGTGGGGVFTADVTNYGTILGGAGGNGGFGTHSGGSGFDGGGGVADAFGYTIVNSGLIEGGAGGAGGTSVVFGGAGGRGGYGVELVSGLLTNTGTIEGGAGGADGGGFANGGPGAEGAGLFLGGGTVVNGSATDTSALIIGGIGVSVFSGFGSATITNYGTIAGYGFGGVAAYLAKTDTFTAEPGSQIVGILAAHEGTLGFGGGPGTLSGLGTGTLGGSAPMTAAYVSAYVIEDGATWTLTGVGSLTAAATLNDLGSLTVAGSFNTYGGKIGVAAGAVMRITGELGNDSTLSVAGTLIDAGVLRNLGPSDEIIISDGGLMQVAGEVANPGTIWLDSVATHSELHVAAVGVTLNGGGVVELSGPGARIVGGSSTATLTNEDCFISGNGAIGQASMTLINEAGGVIEAVGPNSLAVDTAGAVAINSGAMESAYAGDLVINSTTVDQTKGGTITADPTGRVDLDDAVILGGSLVQVGNGVFDISVSGGALRGTTLVGAIDVVGGVSETLTGTIKNTGKLVTLGATKVARLIVGTGGATLAGAGQVNLSSSGTSIIVGAAASDTLNNVNNRISGAGAIGGGSMILVNGVAGAIVANGKVALVLDTGVKTIVNAGLIEEASTGVLIVKSAVANTGALLAASGTLTLDGVVTGSGMGEIKAGTLNVASAFAQTVTFLSGATGVLKLTDFTDFTGRVKGLSTTGVNSIDLVGLAFSATKSKATYTGTTASGVLKVTNGTLTASIVLTGNYLGHAFTLSSDGSGGTKVVDPPAAAPLAQAAAAFRPPSSAATTAHAAFQPPPRPPFVHAP